MEAINAIKSQPTPSPEKGRQVPETSRTKISIKETAPLDNPGEASVKIHQINEAKTEKIAKTIKEYVNSVQTDLQIQVHQRTGDIMVKVISKNDGKVVREIPSEELLNLAAKMQDMMGILFDGNA